jgi:uncharacterized membrane protein YozB (DUF420 family)
MDIYVLLATANLTLQIVVLGLLIRGYWLKRMKKFRQHGINMLTAVVLHIIMVLSVMIPSLLAISEANLGATIVTIAMVHGITGIATVFLGVWLVASWRLRTSLETCFAKKKVMLVTLSLWLVTLSLGILLYLSLYLPSLTGS